MTTARTSNMLRESRPSVDEKSSTRRSPASAGREASWRATADVEPPTAPPGLRNVKLLPSVILTSGTERFSSPKAVIARRCCARVAGRTRRK
eukprot:2533911-Pleurochrysis_carterae.AAC.2